MALVFKKLLKKNFLIIVTLFGLAVAGLAIAQSGGGASAGDLTKGLVGHWPLDSAHYNPSTDRVSDISGYANHGTNYGATLTTDRYGQINGAMEFNGTNTFRTDQLFTDELNQEWTVTGWIYLDRNDTDQYFNNFNSGNKIIHGSTTKALLYGNGGENDHYTYSSGTIPTGQWLYVSYAYRTSDRICKFYLNGSLDKSSTNWNVGEIPSGFSSSTIFGQAFYGKMEEVRVYDRILSEDEIKLLYESYQPQASVGSSNKGLASHYTFDDFSEYTENLYPRDSNTLAFTSAYNCSGYGFGANTNVQQETDNSLRANSKSVITKVSRINSDENQCDYVYLGLSSPLNSTRVISFWYYGTYGTTFGPYNNDGSANLYYLDDDNNWVGGSTSIIVPVPVNQWKKISIKMVNKGEKNGTGWSWFIMHRDNTRVTLSNQEYWAFSEFQMEEKPYATPFIDGTREDLVKDNSGYDSHALLDSNTPKYLEEDDSRQGIYEFFKGEEKRIKLPDPYLGTKTISFWAKVKEGEHISSEAVPFLAYNDGVIAGSGDTRQILLCMQSNKFRMHGWGTLDPIASSSINDGQWHHLVWHMNHHATDANQRLMNMWVDGTKEVADFNYSQGSFGPVADSFWWVGYNSRSYSSYLRDAGILIDDLRFYDRKLSDEEVSLLYAKGQVGSSTELSSGSLNKGLVLDMPLISTWLKDETLGSEIMADRTPYGNDGQNYGATITTDGTDFDGTAASHYVNLGNSITGLDNAFSVDFWIYFRRGLRYGTLPETLAGIVHNLNGNSAGYLGLNYNKAYYDLSFEGGRISGYTSTFSDIRNEWHKFSFVFDKNYIYFYKDGEKFDQIEENTSFLSGSNSVRLGYFTTYWLDGVISDFKIYNRALSADEVKLLYDKGR